MRVVVVTVRVPFVRGGAELLSQELCGALDEHGYLHELVEFPFKWYPPERILDQMLACRLFDLSDSCGVSIDRECAQGWSIELEPRPIGEVEIWLLLLVRTGLGWAHTRCLPLLGQRRGGNCRIIHPIVIPA